MACLATASDGGSRLWHWNERARRFYQSLGARLLGEWQVCRVEGEELGLLAS